MSNLMKIYFNLRVGGLFKPAEAWRAAMAIVSNAANEPRAQA